jgi:uncharacterized membrane protein YraQ (UPF0718 family)
LLLFVLLAFIAQARLSPQGDFFLQDRVQTFVTIFLGIFIEAVPFLLAGSIVAGFIHIFVDQRLLERFIPRNLILGPLAGAALGMFFPVCECGVVPVTRRLYTKGLPVSIGVAFLLAAPVINPIVVVSTYAAFGWGPVLWGRLFFSLLIAFVVGLIFQLATPQEVLLPQVVDAHEHHSHMADRAFGPRAWAALNTAGDDFLDMARYLIAGSMLAALMQTFVAQNLLLSIGQGPVISVLVMQILAFVLSVCSTVDAFLALAFAGTFTTGSIVAFLTFGPMVDIKSSLMFLGVFQRRVVLYLIGLPFLLSLLVGILLNMRWTP